MVGLWTYMQNERPEAFCRAGARLRYLLNIIRRADGPGRLLNIGVGDGQLERIARREGFSVMSLDPDRLAIERMEAAGFVALVGQAEANPYARGSLDAVVLAEVLEHVESSSLVRALQESARVLRPGGLLVGSVPYKEDLALNTVICPACGEQFHRWWHQQSFSAADLRYLLEPRFSVQWIKALVFCDFTGLNWRGWIVEIVRWLAWRLGLARPQRFVFVARKRSDAEGSE